MPGWPGAGSCSPGPGQGRGSDGVRGLGAGSARWHAAFAQPWTADAEKHWPCGIGMPWSFVPADAPGNVFLQATSPGLRSQLGPSPVVTHVAALRGTPARDPGGGSDAAQRCRQGAGSGWDRGGA